MKTNQPGLGQPTILPWHREAAKEINKALLRQNPTVSAIIARHDPHAETLRLLEEALRKHDIARDVHWRQLGLPRPSDDDPAHWRQIRARLAAMKGSK